MAPLVPAPVRKSAPRGKRVHDIALLAFCCVAKALGRSSLGQNAAALVRWRPGVAKWRRRRVCSNWCIRQLPYHRKGWSHMYKTSAHPHNSGEYADQRRVACHDPRPHRRLLEADRDSAQHHPSYDWRAHGTSTHFLSRSSVHAPPRERRSAMVALPGPGPSVHEPSQRCKPP